MRHLPGVINASDDLTKPLSTLLHSRHVLRAMGHYRSSSIGGFRAILPASEAGEGVEAQSEGPAS